MRINHNIAALNTYRQLNTANAAQGRSMEKLSSGLRINNAKDDAAGLAISEKMRGQIRGLEQAGRNAQDGISLIQTGEGALNETHDILQRMRELAVQSSNDTNTDDDRAEIQKEVTQLAQEVTRIAKNTEFNTQNLLDGSFAAKFQIGSNAGQNIDLGINAMDATTLAVGTGGATTYASGTVGAVTGTASNVAVTMGTYAGDNVTGVTVDTTALTASTTSTYSGGSVTPSGDALNFNALSIGSYDGANVTGVAIDTTSVTAVSSYSEGAVTGTATAGTNNVTLSGTTFNQADTITVTFTNAGGAGVGGTGELAVATTSGNSYTLTDNSDGTYTATNSTTAGNSFTFNINAFEVDGDAFSFDVTGGTTYGGTATIGTGADATTFNVNADGTTAAADSTQTFAGITLDVSGATPGSAASFDISGQTVASSTTTYGGNIDIGGTTFTVASDGTATASTGTYAGLAANVTGAAAGQTGTFDISGRTSATSAVAGIDVSTQALADTAITVINDAIKTVSGERSKLGSYQNRLEHTINNLNTSSENLTAAESRIRDVDYALAA